MSGSAQKLIEAPKMDLDNYISNYRGRTRINRLLHIGATSSYHEVEAFKFAVVEAKKGLDVSLYRKAVEELARTSALDVAEAELDQTWIAKTKNGVDRETARLESELKGYKNNLIKESIRMGYDDLGKHLYASGDMTEAQKTYQKQRDYCQNPAHITQMNLHLISVLVDLRAWHSVEITAQRLHHLSNKPGAEKDEAKLNAVLGLAAMSQRKYAEAAKSFLLVHEKMLEAELDDPFDDGAFNEVLTPNDVATYGALCALASMDRVKLQQDVLDNSKFRAFLELEPHLRRAISAFISGRYNITLSVLESYKTDFLLDIHLHAHLNSLFQAIRSKAITEYFNAFSSISLSDLGQVIGTGESEVQDAAIELIKSGDLKARLDLENGLLIADTQDERRDVQTAAVDLSENHEQTALMRLMRLELILSGLEVRGSAKADTSGRVEFEGTNIASRLGRGWRFGCYDHDRYSGLLKRHNWLLKACDLDHTESLNYWIQMSFNHLNQTVSKDPVKSYHRMLSYLLSIRDVQTQIHLGISAQTFPVQPKVMQS